MASSALLNIAGTTINAAIPYASTIAGPLILNACPGRMSRPLLIIAPAAMQKISQNPSFRANVATVLSVNVDASLPFVAPPVENPLRLPCCAIRGT